MSVFRVGGPFTGVGVVVGLVLPCRSASSSGSLFLLSERSPRFFQRLKSMLVGVLGWWLLRLHRCSRSSGGGGALGFALERLVQSAGPEQRRKTNRASRVLFVIFFFDGVLVVKGGCTVIQSNISSLSQKKRERLCKDDYNIL